MTVELTCDSRKGQMARLRSLRGSGNSGIKVRARMQATTSHAILPVPLSCPWPSKLTLDRRLRPCRSHRSYTAAFVSQPLFCYRAEPDPQPCLTTKYRRCTRTMMT